MKKLQIKEKLQILDYVSRNTNDLWELLGMTRLLIQLFENSDNPPRKWGIEYSEEYYRDKSLKVSSGFSNISE